jgi:hypothetical protein
MQRQPLGGPEHLRFALDVLGAQVGTFEMDLKKAPAADRGRAALLIEARGKSSDLISSNVKRVDGWTQVLVSADGQPVRYREEMDEGETHRSQEVSFPAPDGNLPIRATKNGDPEQVALAATPSARDLLSGLYELRRQPLDAGAHLCAEVYAARRMWKVEGTVADKRETIETPLGKFETVRIDSVATRLDDPKVVRKAHLWVTPDERRLPVVILGEIRGRFVRAQLTEAKLGRGRKIQAQR